MIENLTTEKLESHTRNLIHLYRPSFTEWEYRVEAGTHSPENIWAFFNAKKLILDGHYLIIGKREDHNIIKIKIQYDYLGRDNLSKRQREMLDEGNSFRGIAHTEDEANNRLIQICREEAKRMENLYFNGEVVKFRDNL